MATRTISDAGGNYNDTGTWVEGAVPDSTDDVVATGTSGNLTVNVTSVCGSIDFTNYVATLTMNDSLTVSTGGIVTFVAAMTITTSSGTPSLSLVGNHTITSNAKVWPYAVAFQGFSTKTLADDWTVDGNLSVTFSGAVIDGNNLYLNGGISGGTGKTLGTTKIVLGGGLWDSVEIGNDLDFNTATVVTIAAGVAYGGGTLRYVAGTVDTTTNSSRLFLMDDSVIDTSTVLWFDVYNNSTVFSKVFTLNSQFTMTNMYLFNANILTFDGAFGFETDKLIWGSSISTNNKIVLEAGVTYTVNDKIITNSLVEDATDPFLSIESSHGTNRAILNLTPGCDQGIFRTNSIRIDSSGGDAVFNYKGTNTDSINWTESCASVALPTVSYVKV
jgi:hypothetical protein